MLFVKCVNNLIEKKNTWIEQNSMELLLIWELMMCQRNKRPYDIADSIMSVGEKCKECYDFQFST